jgi:hypothetical protein
MGGYIDANIGIGFIVGVTFGVQVPNDGAGYIGYPYAGVGLMTSPGA